MKPANLCLKIEISQPITTDKKEKILFSVRDRLKSIMHHHEIDEYKILFTPEKKNNNQ